MSIVIKKVDNKKLLKEFVEFPNKLYKGNKYYVPDLFQDEMNSFDRSKNVNYEINETVEFLAYKDGKVAGRISGLINNPYNALKNISELRFNHFDVIDDVEVSRALFNAIGEWGLEKGLVTFDGPIGHNDLDKQGMLMDGYEEPGMFITNYNYPYYVKHMEALGFVKDVDWIELRIKCPEISNPRIEKVSAFLLEKYNYKKVRVRNIKELNPYIPELFKVYNEAFAPLHGVVPLNQRQIDMYVKNYISMLNFDYISLVLNSKDEMVGLAVLAPDLTPALQKNRGKLFPFGWIPLLHSLKHPKVLDMFFIAVKPEYQGQGINGILMSDITSRAIKNGVTCAETGPELEDNAKVISQWKDFDAQIIRKRRCWMRKIEKL